MRLRRSVDTIVSCGAGHATTGAANAGAATRAAAPCRRGYSLAATGRISVSAAAGVSVRSASAGAHGALDEVPGRVISPPMYNACRIERVDDRRQAQPEVARSGLRAATALASPARARAIRSSMVKCARAASPGRLSAGSAEVAGQRGEIRDVRLPAAVRAARTPRTVERQRHVPELAGDVVTAAQHLAVDDDADADAVRDAHEHQVAAGGARPPERPRLRQRARAAGVLDLHREPGRGGERIAQVDVAPAERRRVQHASSSSARPCRARRRRCPRRRPRRDARRAAPRSAAPAPRRAPWVASVGNDVTPAIGLPDQVGEHHERLAGPDVDRDDRPAARVDVEERRLPPAHGLARGAFEDQPARAAGR